MDMASGFQWLLQLPRDIKMSILSRLDFASRIRLAAVCRAWRDLLSSPEFSPPAEMPWLWMCPNQLLELSRSIVYNLNPHEKSPSYTNCIGSYGPWLIIMEKMSPYAQSSFFFNPFSHARIQLPQRTHIEDGYDIATSCFCCATLSCLPTRDNLANGKCMVAALDYGNNLFVCLPRDVGWILVCKSVEKDVVFCNSKLYAIRKRTRTIMVFDVKNYPYIVASSEIQTKQCIDTRHFLNGTFRSVGIYLVESGGELLVVSRCSSWLCHLTETEVSFRVFKLDNSNLVEVTSLGNLVLFVGYGCSRSCSAPCLVEFFKANCIYFIKAEEDKSIHYLGKYCLEDKHSVVHSDIIPLSCPPHLFHLPLVWISPNSAC